MQNKMKIAYIVDGFPKLSETFVLNQITGLIDRGHQVEIISCYHPDEDQVHEDVKRYGLLERVHYLNWKEGKGMIEAQNAVAIAPCLDVDVAHAHFLARPADVALDVLERVGIPYVVTAHAYDIFTELDVARLRKRCRGATRVLTVSEFNRRYLIDLLGSELSANIHVHRLGVDLNRFPFVDRSGRTGMNPKVLFVGRLVEKKGPLDAVESFAGLRQQVPGARLIILGDGPLAGALDERINELGISEWVERLGATTIEKVAEQIVETDIFLLPSRTGKNGDREGLPVALIEALATGLPVVSTRHSGIPELVVDGVSGVLVAEGDITGLTEGLIRLATSPNLRLELGQAGRKRVEQEYDLKTSLDALEAHLSASAVAGRDALAERLAHYLPSVIAEARAHADERAIKLEQRTKDLEQRIRSLENVLERVRNTPLFRTYTFLRGRGKTK